MTGETDWGDLYEACADKFHWTADQVNAHTAEQIGRMLGHKPEPASRKDSFWRVWLARGLTDEQIAERWKSRPRRKLVKP